MSRDFSHKGFGRSEGGGRDNFRSHFDRGPSFNTDFGDFSRGASHGAGDRSTHLPDFGLENGRSNRMKDKGEARDSDRQKQPNDKESLAEKLSKHPDRDSLKNRLREFFKKADERRENHRLQTELDEMMLNLQNGLFSDAADTRNARHRKNPASKQNSRFENGGGTRERQLSSSGGDPGYGNGSDGSNGGAGYSSGGAGYSGSGAEASGQSTGQGYSPGTESGNGAGLEPQGAAPSTGGDNIVDNFGGIINDVKAKASDVVSSLSGSVRDLVNAAASLKGQKLWVNSPVDVAGGVYGCAASVSEVLIQSGVIDRSEYNGSVSGVESLLSTPKGQPTPPGTTLSNQLGKGWIRVDGPVPGAVVCGYRTSRPAFDGGAHIGVVGPDGTTVFNNHSDSTTWSEDPISAFNSSEYSHDVAYYVPPETVA